MQHYTHQMTQLSVLMEEAIQIAWDYLERSGNIEDGDFCGGVLADSIETMIRQGVRNRLVLANRAIEHYLRALGPRTLRAAS